MENHQNEIEYYKSKLEQLKTLKSKTMFTKNFASVTQIGAIISLYCIFSASNITPFKQDMLKTFVPAIETFNDQDEHSNPVLDFTNQYAKETDLKLLLEYNTPFEQINNGMYQKIHYTYSYTNKDEEELRNLLANPILLNDTLTKECEYVEYANNINEQENYQTYNVQNLNKEKSTYLYNKETKSKNNFYTLIFCLSSILLISPCYLLKKHSLNDLEQIEKEIDEYEKELALIKKINPNDCPSKPF